MSRQIYVNLPVKDLEQSLAFFQSLGFAADPQFTNHNAACLVVSETIYVMLLVEPFFGSFIPREICDTTTHVESLICLSAESRAEVDEMVARALAAGGTVLRPPQDHGFMYVHGFADLDGHVWELLWMDKEAMRQAS